MTRRRPQPARNPTAKARVLRVSHKAVQIAKELADENDFWIGGMPVKDTRILANEILRLDRAARRLPGRKGRGK